MITLPLNSYYSFRFPKLDSAEYNLVLKEFDGVSETTVSIPESLVLLSLSGYIYHLLDKDTHSPLHYYSLVLSEDGDEIFSETISVVPNPNSLQVKGTC